MSYGMNYPGAIILGGDAGAPVAFKIIVPNTLGDVSNVYAPKIKNAHLLIVPDKIVSSATLYAPKIFGALTLVSPDLLKANGRIYRPGVNGELAPNDTAPAYDFYRRTFLPVRDIIAGVQISFIKGYDPNADFFTVGSSAFDSGDVYQGNGTTIQEWDKFAFTDYSDFLSSLTYKYEQDVLGSMILGYADITLDNTTDLFSPYGDSPIADLILPYRPLKIYTGYKQQPHQVFVGQTTRLPKADSTKAQFHAMDFIASFADVEITNGLTFVGVTTDEVIDYVLQNYAGLSPVQYTLDVGLNTISFLHVEPDTKIGALFRKLIEAEQGRLYQTYEGEIRFDNRNNKMRPTAIELRKDWVFDEKEPEEGNVINRVKVTSDVRTVMPSQQIYPPLKDGSLTQYADFQAIKIAAGETIEKFFDTKDPITHYTHPAIGAGITANTAQDGSGANRNADLSFSVLAEFTTSVKYSFTNNSATDLYVTSLIINGTPAKITKEIRVDISDATSIGKYGEQLLEIKNDYFTSQTYATAVANEIVTNNKDAPSIREISVKGIPYAAVADVITYYDGLTYVIDSISGKISPSDGHKQDMLLRRVNLA